MTSVSPIENEELEKSYPFAWSEEFSLGIPNIDVQHMAFVSFINDAYRSATIPGRIGELRTVLENLIQYAKIHFGYEERLIDEHKYPHAEKHKKEHWEFVVRVEQLMKEDISGDSDAHLATCLFMKDWLIHHIGGSDRKYAEFFKSKNIEV